MKKVKIGFTGTQIGMTAFQKSKISSTLDKIIDSIESVGHGDCVGSDADFHEICKNKNIDIIIYPPINVKKRAYCSGAIETKQPKEYLDRNKDIVNESDILIATPDSTTEKLRSGTWSTIRYARNMKKPVYIIFPNGTVSK